MNGATRRQSSGSVFFRNGERTVRPGSASGVSGVGWSARRGCASPDAGSSAGTRGLRTVHRSLLGMDQRARPIAQWRALAGHIAATDAHQRGVWEPYRRCGNRIGSERGWGPTSRAGVEQELKRAFIVGVAETVALKIVATMNPLAWPVRPQVQRGYMAHDLVMRSIELPGGGDTKVRDLLADG